MNIKNYVKKHWDELPKSNFNDEKMVIIKEIRNDNEGWGHHNYEGYGIDEKGDLYWCYSSGCSCNGSCGTDHKLSGKTFNVDWPDEFADLDPQNY